MCAAECRKRKKSKMYYAGGVEKKKVYLKRSNILVHFVICAYIDSIDYREITVYNNYYAEAPQRIVSWDEGNDCYL